MWVSIEAVSKVASRYRLSCTSGLCDPWCSGLDLTGHPDIFTSLFQIESCGDALRQVFCFMCVTTSLTACILSSPFSSLQSVGFPQTKLRQVQSSELD